MLMGQATGVCAPARRFESTDKERFFECVASVARNGAVVEMVGNLIDNSDMWFGLVHSYDATPGNWIGTNGGTI